MDFREKKLYHQIHPLKLATDIGVTPLALNFVWEHRVLPGLLVAFVPPVIVSLAMLKWTSNLEKVKRSAFGRYIKKYMTPFIELTRLLTLVPMAYGAWNHDFRFIVLALVILVVAWCNGLIWQAFRRGEPQVAGSPVVRVLYWLGAPRTSPGTGRVLRRVRKGDVL